MKREGLFLDILPDHLSLGLAPALQARQEGTADFAQAKAHLQGAVNGLRQGGNQSFITRGLLALAGLRRVTGVLDPPRADLDEALSIATRNGMDVYQR